eukprot:Gb_01395 [translate_table: standard]
MLPSTAPATLSSGLWLSSSVITLCASTPNVSLRFQQTGLVRHNSSNETSIKCSSALPNLSRCTAPMSKGNNMLFHVGLRLTPDVVLRDHCSVLLVVDDASWIIHRRTLVTSSTLSVDVGNKLLRW